MHSLGQISRRLCVRSLSLSFSIANWALSPVQKQNKLVFARWGLVQDERRAALPASKVSARDFIDADRFPEPAQLPEPNFDPRVDPR